MQELDNLEIHVTHACNLACESCSHYSNQGHKGMLSLEEADQWMKLWNGRIRPKVFSLLGGEPTLHPRLVELLWLARRNWPASALRLASNGLLLHRHPELPRTLRETGTVLRLSIHHDSPEYQEKIRPALERVREWVRAEGVRCEILESYQWWTRRYHGFGDQMEPFADGQPRQSWERCPARFFRQLFDGRLWKCAPIAYLRLQHAKYGLARSWDPYLAYQPLSAVCSEEELSHFLGREEETCCGMCPAHPERMALPSPLLSVGVRRRRQTPEKRATADSGGHFQMQVGW